MIQSPATLKTPVSCAKITLFYKHVSEVLYIMQKLSVVMRRKRVRKDG